MSIYSKFSKFIQVSNSSCSLKLNFCFFQGEMPYVCTCNKSSIAVTFVLFASFLCFIDIFFIWNHGLNCDINHFSIMYITSALYDRITYFMKELYHKARVHLRSSIMSPSLVEQSFAWTRAWFDIDLRYLISSILYICKESKDKRGSLVNSLNLPVSIGSWFILSTRCLVLGHLIHLTQFMTTIAPQVFLTLLSSIFFYSK